MSCLVTNQDGSEASGRPKSFWLSYDLIAKLQRMARNRGVKVNRVVRQLIEEAPDPGD